MLKFFSTGHFSRYIVLSFLILLFWIPEFINPVYYKSVTEPLFIFISKLLGVNTYLSIAVTLIISIFSALLINQLATDFEISGRFSSLGIFYFILISSAIPAFYSFNPMIIVNVFILFLFINVFRIPTASITISVAFNSGFLIGIASFFFPPLIILLFFLWGAIIIHRMTEWRNFVASLVGIVLPYLFLFTWYFWTDSVYENAVILYEDFFFIPSYNFPEFSLNLIIIIYLFIIITISALNILGHLREKNINLRRNLMITVLYLAFVLGLSWYYFNTMETMLLAAIPGALLLSNLTLQSKRLKPLNITIYLLLGLIFLNLYLGLGKYLLAS